MSDNCNEQSDNTEDHTGKTLLDKIISLSLNDCHFSSAFRVRISSLGTSLVVVTLFGGGSVLDKHPDYTSLSEMSCVRHIMFVNVTDGHGPVITKKIMM